MGDGSAEWLRAVYLRAKRSVGGSCLRVGRRFVRLAQVVAVCILMRGLDLSPESCREMFRRRPDLRRATRFLHAPSAGWLRAARSICAALRLVIVDT